ncbi:MAG: glycerophosphodiester phosphodiesterase, partial [bacterium]|nr:glycerophosphodiester phosphodiesterase [bacterium]
MRVIAHRGASVVEHENTLEAFREAVRQHADGIELDVRRTANDVLVVHHDAHLPDGRAIIELHDDKLPDWVPTLAEVMDVCRAPASEREFVINIEIKSAPNDPDYDAEHQVSAAVAGLV